MAKHLLSLLSLTGALVLLSPGAKAQAPDGKQLYLKNCRSCHGATGKPTKQALREHPKIRALDAEFMGTIPLDSMVAVITRGFGKGDEMKPFKDKLTKEEIEAVARYVKNELKKKWGTMQRLLSSQFNLATAGA